MPKVIKGKRTNYCKQRNYCRRKSRKLRQRVRVGSNLLKTSFREPFRLGKSRLPKIIPKNCVLSEEVPARTSIYLTVKYLSPQIWAGTRCFRLPAVCDLRVRPLSIPTLCWG